MPSLRPAALPFVFLLAGLLGTPGLALGQPTADGPQLVPATLSYDATMKTRDRSIALSSTQTISATITSGTRTWTAVRTTQTPRATVTDSLVVHRSTLRPVARHVRGPMRLDVTYTDSSASGTIEMPNRSFRIDESFAEPVLAGGPNNTLVLATLPLTSGFSTTFSLFDGRQQSVETRTYSVQGTETVTTSAGSFDTYLLTVSSKDGGTSGTMHLRQRAPHYIVKATIEQSGAQGARTVTQTLSSIKLHPTAASETE